MTLLVTLLSLSLSTLVRADDVVFDATRDAPIVVSVSEPIDAFRPDVRLKPLTPNRDLILAASGFIAQIVAKFMSGMVPDNQGIDHPLPDENAIDQFVSPIGRSRFQWVFQGAGNLKILSGPYLYNEVQGGVGMEYDLVGRSANALQDQPDTLLVIRISPLYGEIAYIRVLSGVLSPQNLPQRDLLGASFGIEAMRRLGIVELGARAYARPLVEADGAREAGVALYSALYCRIKLAEMHWNDVARKSNLYLTPTISYYDRGPGAADLANAREPGLTRGVGDIRRFWIGQLNLEIRM